MLEQNVFNITTLSFGDNNVRILMNVVISSTSLKACFD